MTRTFARTVATIARAAGATAAPRRAPARASASAPAALAPVVVMLDGAPEPIGSHNLATKSARLEFVGTVLATYVSLAAGGALVEPVSCTDVAPGLYLGGFWLGTTFVSVLFGTADAPAPVTSAEPPATKRLPLPAVAAEMKATAATARATRTPAHVHVILKHAGGFALDVTEADLADPAAFMRQHVAPRVAAYHGWPRCGVDYAARAGSTSYHGAVSHGRTRQTCDWQIVPATATLAYVLPERAGQGFARPVSAPVSAIDLGARMGLKPAGHHVAEAEARAKSAGVRLSRADRAVAEAADAAASRPIVAGRTPSGHAVDAAPRMNAENRAILEAAGKGTLPAAPDFTAPTHERYRGKLAELVAMVSKGDVAGLRAYPINPISTSPKALNRYRNAAVVALEVRAAAKAKRAA